MVSTPQPSNWLTAWDRCPHCGAVLTSTRCSRCGLPLGGPNGVRLADLSVAAAAAARAGSPTAPRLIAERSRLVAQMLAQPPGAPPLAAPPAFAPQAFAPQAAPGQPFPLPAAPGQAWPGREWRPPGSAQTFPPFQPASNPPSQWTPTTALALVGAVLVAAAALGFAFIVPDLGWSARVIALAFGAVAAGAGALFLKARRITATGEAMAAVAAALALLTWAVAIQPDGLEGPSAGWSGASLLALAALIYLAG
ncbi:MAG: hypothetical protein LBD70_08805, partial [Bifidobacteriaceae bacterium]|nr:hypothetical protein [Bifidobacteriaceae bacterium]